MNRAAGAQRGAGCTQGSRPQHSAGQHSVAQRTDDVLPHGPDCDGEGEHHRGSHGHLQGSSRGWQAAERRQPLTGSSSWPPGASAPTPPCPAPHPSAHLDGGHKGLCCPHVAAHDVRHGINAQVGKHITLHRRPKHNEPRRANGRIHGAAQHHAARHGLQRSRGPGKGAPGHQRVRTDAAGPHARCLQAGQGPCSAAPCACGVGCSSASLAPAGARSSGTQTCMCRGVCVCVRRGRGSGGRHRACPHVRTGPHMQVRRAARQQEHQQAHAVMITGTVARMFLSRSSALSPKNATSGSQRTGGRRPAAARQEHTSAVLGRRFGRPPALA